MRCYHCNTDLSGEKKYRLYSNYGLVERYHYVCKECYDMWHDGRMDDL